MGKPPARVRLAVFRTSCTITIVTPEELRIVDSLRAYSDLPDGAWAALRSEVSKRGVAAASASARRQLAAAMLKAQAVAKGDYVGHPFRGNQWTTAEGQSRGGSASAVVTDVKGRPSKAEAMLVKRPKPVKVKTVEEALERMARGEVVELESDREVNTLLEKLHDAANRAKAEGRDFSINLCNVSVAGTNIFCGSSLAGEDGKPLPRAVMPQLSGRAREGSAAARAADKNGEADAGPPFLKFLEEHGVKVEEKKVNAAKLKASQAELIGSKVAGIMTAGKWDAGTVYISSDGYVIDGHHRWAAAVGADAKDGLGDLEIKVVQVDMPITEALEVANAFTEEYGIERKAAKRRNCATC